MSNKDSVIKPTEVWDFDICFSEYAIPRLKKLKDNLQLYPGIEGANSIEEWESILDKIILAFELHIDMSNMDEKYFQYDEDGKLSKESLALAENDNIKIDEGLALFAKWFRYLWA